MTASSGCSIPAPASSARSTPAAARFEPIAFCPGYLRGLAFHGDFAIVGLSQPRENKTFAGLPLDEALARRNAEPRLRPDGHRPRDRRRSSIGCGSRASSHELYDVVALPGVRRPMALGFKTDEIRRILTIED